MFNKHRQFPYGPWQKAFDLDALRRAWQSIRHNKGTSGADGQTIAQFEQELERNLELLRAEAISGRYRPHKVTQVLVPKANSDWRPLTLWAIRDRILQRAVFNYLEPVFELHFLPCSYGFRAGRGPREAARAIQKAYQQGARWVVDADIKDCFGQMRSEIVMDRLYRWYVPKPIQAIIQAWLTANVWNAWQNTGRQVGTSQGSAISPLLCNLYLHPFDQQMWQRRWWFIRYADDFVILTRDEKSAHQANTLAGKTLQTLGLEIHAQKTGVRSFEQSFQFVGWFFVRDEMYEMK